MRSLVVAYVKELKDHDKMAIWFQTDQGWDWLYDDEEERDEYPPLFDGDIVEYIVQEYLYNKASNWSNERIRSYLDR